jgi:hypothetical protein
MRETFAALRGTTGETVTATGHSCGLRLFDDAALPGRRGDLHRIPWAAQRRRSPWDDHVGGADDLVGPRLRVFAGDVDAGRSLGANRAVVYGRRPQRPIRTTPAVPR